MKVIQSLFSSKKFLAKLVGMMAVLLSLLSPKLGIPLSEEQAAALAQYVAGLAAAFIVAQGAADLGKHAEEIRSNGNGNGHRQLPTDGPP